MADINAYALSLSLTLQDQASTALRTMVNLANDLEQKVLNIQRQFNTLGNVGTTAGVNINKQFKIGSG